jgi:hypothetical protein
MFVGTQLNIVHASKLSIWLNYVRSSSTKKKYESWKSFHTLESFHIYESFSIAPAWNYRMHWLNELPGTRPNSQSLGQLFQTLGQLLQSPHLKLYDALPWWHSTEFSVTQLIVPDKTQHLATSLAKHSESADEIWYQGYHTNWIWGNGTRGPPWVGPLG